MSFSESMLTVNCGSSSLKVDLFGVQSGQQLSRLASITISALPDRLEGAMRLPERTVDLHREEPGGPGGALRLSVEALQDQGLFKRIGAIGHRVVHGGRSLAAPALIDAAVLRQIEEASEMAPIHNRPALEAIRECRRVIGDGVPMVATFDTAFFSAMPAVAATYAIPVGLADELGIRRFGFHGLAHRFMSERFAELRRRNQARIVTLQLGSGCSAAAIKDGRPVDTSMGFTPLEGLVMSTRSGDMDPSLPGYIGAKKGLSAEDVEVLLNERSGLMGLSGRSADVRDLLRAELDGDGKARLALDLFCYRVRKYIGAYAAALGGLDGLVFGGGIGENSPEVRERVCRGMEWLGLTLDREANQAAAGGDILISEEESPVTAYVVAVDEASIIAADTHECLSGRSGGG